MNKTVEIARSYVNTPYHHQGRLKYHGVDCVGLLVCVAREVGYIDENWDILGYDSQPDGISLMKYMREVFSEIPKEEMQPGDFISVSFDKYPQHVGILGDYKYGGLSLIHASGKHMKVVETRLLFTDNMKFEGAFRYVKEN